MSDGNPMGQVIQIDEVRIRDHLGEMVRGTVEETLNAMLDAEADQLCGASHYERGWLAVGGLNAALARVFATCVFLSSSICDREPGVVRSDPLVTFARTAAEGLHINNRYIPASVVDDPRALQRACHERNTGAANAQHLR
jgi:hypothetical protein